MAVELIVPEVGESVTEVEIGQWLVNEGDAVEKDQPIVEIETDKVSLELPAPEAGVLSKITHAQGAAASVGDVIGMLEPGATPSSNGKASAKSEEPKKAAPEPEPVEPPTKNAESAAPSGGDAPRVMPAAQRLIDENNLDVSAIEATGPGGRLLKEDVLRHLEGKEGKSKAAPERSEGADRPAKPAEAPAAPSSPPTASDREEVVKLSPLRRTIAKSLVNAQQTAALLTTFNEVDMTAIMDLRGQYKDSFAEVHGVKLGFMSFFVKASIDALKQFPAVNSEIQGDHVVYKNHYDIGIAIGGGKGLVVPVLRDADAMSFAEIEKSIGTYAKAAQANKIKLEDLQGGTFTITNGGVYGSLLSTPIVNAPQSGVLGMHGIIRRPIAVGSPGKDERVEIRPMMYIALTYDHRIVDGREAVTFLKRIKDACEDPARMLLEA